MTPSETTALIDKHLSGWLGSGAAGDTPGFTLRDRIAAMIAEAEKKRDELWKDGNATLTHERDILARWKEEALIVMSWWNEIDAFIRAHPDCRLGDHVSHRALEFLKERDELKSKLVGAMGEWSSWRLWAAVMFGVAADSEDSDMRSKLGRIYMDATHDLNAAKAENASLATARDDAVQAAHLIAEELAECKRRVGA